MKKVERLLKFNTATCNNYIKSGVAFHSSLNRLRCITFPRLNNMENEPKESLKNLQAVTKPSSSNPFETSPRIRCSLTALKQNTK